MLNRLCLLALLTVGVLVPGLSSASSNMLINGDFEANSGDVASGWYTTVNAGDPLIAGWTVGQVSVDLIKGWTGTIQGVSVDLAGTPGPGSLSQSFSAVAGYTYSLDWDFGNNDGTILQVSLGGTAQSFTPSNPFQHGQLQWVAPVTGSSFVKFSSGTDGSNSGPTIDNVVLTAVPEPQAAALMLAGLLVVGGVARARGARTKG